MGSSRDTRERSLPKGLLAGMIGGIAGAAAILLAEEIFPPHEQGEPEPVSMLPGSAQKTPPAVAEPDGGQPLHWAVGALAGGLYGVAAEMEPSLGAWRGAAFGVALNRLTNETLLPRMGLSPSNDEQSTQARTSHWISHAIYGIVTDSVHRVVRRLL
jgi:putative membrane protein